MMIASEREKKMRELDIELWNILGTRQHAKFLEVWDRYRRLKDRT